MFEVLRAVRDAFIPPELRRGPDTVRMANRIVAFHLAMLCWVPIFSLLYMLAGCPNASNVVLSGGVIAIASLLLLQRVKSLSLCVNILCGGAWYVYTTVAFYTGGIQAPVIFWFASLPVLSILVAGNRVGTFYTLASVLTVTAFAAAHALGFECPNEIPRNEADWIQYLAIIGMLLCVYILVALLKNMEHFAREELHEANARLRVLASVDALTGIANRRGFDMALEQEWRRHARTQQPLSVALIDTDLFKQYNDCLGHLAGDECLRTLAEVIRGGIHRGGDLAARYGGEEFALILPDTDEAAGAHLAEMMHARVAAIKIPHPDSLVSPYITISIGLATAIPDREDSWIDFIGDADRALYRAKALGRNRTVRAATKLEPVC